MCAVKARHGQAAVVRDHAHALTHLQRTHAISPELAVFLAEADEMHPSRELLSASRTRPNPQWGSTWVGPGSLDRARAPRSRIARSGWAAMTVPRTLTATWIRSTAPDGRLESVEQRIVSRAHLRHPIEMVHMHHRGCRSHAHFGERQADPAQALRQADHGVALGCGDSANLGGIHAVVALAAVSEQPHELNGRAEVEVRRERHGFGGVGQNARSTIPAVHLQEHLGGTLQSRGLNGLDRNKRVHEHVHAQREGLWNPVRSDRHRQRDVIKALACKGPSLRQGRDGDAAEVSPSPEAVRSRHTCGSSREDEGGRRGHGRARSSSGNWRRPGPSR